MKIQKDNQESRTDTVENDDLAVIVVLKGTQSSPIPVIISGGGGGTSSTVTRIPVSIVPVVLLASNGNRVTAFITNNSSTSTLYVLAGTGVPSIAPGAELFSAIVKPGKAFGTDVHEYSGIIQGIWDTADAAGEALVTEVLP